MSKPRLHGKGEQFNQEFRPIVIRGNDEKLISGNSNPRRRQNANGMVHRGGQKFKWVLINRENHAETHYGTKGGCTKTNAEKDTSLHIDLKPGVQTFPEKTVESASTSKLAYASSDISVGSSMKVGVGGKAAHRLKIGEHC
jgi:hypothetical protein